MKDWSDDPPHHERTFYLWATSHSQSEKGQGNKCIILRYAVCILFMEGNVLFNNALNTFYLRLYGVRYMVKDHSDSERGNPLPPHRLLAARVIWYASSHRQDNTYLSLCYTSCGALAGTRNSSMGLPHEGSIRRPIAPWANALTTELHLAPNIEKTWRNLHRILWCLRFETASVGVTSGGGWMCRLCGWRCSQVGTMEL